MHVEVVKVVYVFIETQLSERNQNLPERCARKSPSATLEKKPHLQSAFSESAFDAKKSDTVLGTQNLVPPVLTTIESPLGVTNQVTLESSNTVQADVATIVQKTQLIELALEFPLFSDINPFIKTVAQMDFP
ncbi:hypothetical protein IWQ61_010090, partial [Dispira simplex]